MIGDDWIWCLMVIVADDFVLMRIVLMVKMK